MMALICTSIPFSFAETPPTTKTPGQTLAGLGLVSGYANGDLAESDQLTRAQMMVLIAQLKGENEMAKNYALPSTSIDVDPYAWYAPYIAYAESRKWTAGVSKNRFGPDEKLTSQQAATFMLKILGYPVTNYDTVMDQAYALGLLKNSTTVATEKINRGSVFQYMLNTLYTPTANSSVTLGVSLGVVKPEKPAVVVPKYIVKSISTLSNTLLEVKLTDPTTVAEMGQFVVRSSNGTILELVKADLIDPKTIWLTTKAQTPGSQYTLLADKEFRFAGMSRDILAPILVKDSSRVLDFITVKLVFDKDMDPRSALDVANYKAEGGITFLSAKFDKDKDGNDIKTSVILSSSSQERNKLYTVNVQKQVVDVSGNSVSTEEERNIFRFVGLVADNTAPRLTSVYSLNAQKLMVLFDDQSDLDIASAENVGNYNVINRTNVNNGVNVISAKVIKNTSDKYLLVELRTTQQVIGNSYEISISNVTDKFGNIISSTNSYKGSFTGQAADTNGPKLLFLQPISNIRIDLMFDETVTKETAEVTANYSIDGNLSIVKAERDADDNKKVHLTTTSQLSSTLYKIKAFGVMDEFGNVNSNTSSNTAYFNGMYEDISRPKVATATASVEDNKTYVTVTYTKNMGDSAKIGSNYYFGTDIGYGLAVIKISETQYKVRTNSQSEGTSYSVSVGNVLDASGNGLDDSYIKATFFGKAVSDSEPPKIAYVVTADKKTIRFAFNRPMQTSSTGQVVASDGIAKDSDISDPDNYQVFISGSTTPISLGSYKAYVDKDKMSVTLRFGTNVLDSDKNYTVQANATETTDPIDGNTTSLYAENGLSLTNSYASYGFRGSPIDAPKPRIVSAFATSTNTIEIKFSTGVKLGTFTGTSLTLTGNGQTLIAVPANTLVSTTDSTMLLVRLSGKMSTSSAQYQVRIDDLSCIKDMYDDLILDSTSGGNVATLYSNSIENDGPSLNSVAANDATSVTLVFNKELDAAQANDYRVTTDSADIVPQYAEFVNNKRDTVRIYFDSTTMSLGKAYKVKIATNAIADIYGKTNGYSQEEYFGLSSVGRSKVSISDFGSVGTSTLRVMFSKPIANTVGMMTGADFTILNTASGGAWVIDKAYSNGTVVLPDSLGRLPQNQHVDILDLKCSKVLSKDITYTLSFTTPLAFVAKDGAVIDGTPSRSTVGQLNLDTLKLTSGISTTALGSGGLKASVTDTLLSSYTIKSAYTKVGAFVKASSPVPYDTQVKLIEGINGFDKTKLVAKNVSGVTDFTLTGLTAGNYDLVVVFYNQKNELVGYYLVSTVAVN
jgi:hypothetical protein